MHNQPCTQTLSGAHTLSTATTEVGHAARPGIVVDSVLDNPIHWSSPMVNLSNFPSLMHTEALLTTIPIYDLKKRKPNSPLTWEQSLEMDETVYDPPLPIQTTTDLNILTRL